MTAAYFSLPTNNVKEQKNRHKTKALNLTAPRR